MQGVKAGYEGLKSPLEAGNVHQERRLTTVILEHSKDMREQLGDLMLSRFTSQS